jgi:hypothetical protein
MRVNPTSAVVCLNSFFRENLGRGEEHTGSKSFVSEAELLRLIASGRKPCIVKTNPLVIGFEMSTMAVRICDAAIGARMGSGMPIGLWSSPIAPHGSRGNAWSPILASWMSVADWESNTRRNQSLDAT